jgi:hypothetical protein
MISMAYIIFSALLLLLISQHGADEPGEFQGILGVKEEPESPVLHVIAGGEFDDPADGLRNITREYDHTYPSARLTLSFCSPLLATARLISSVQADFFTLNILSRENTAIR